MALGRGLEQILFDVEKAYEKDLGDISNLDLQGHKAKIEDIDVNKINTNPYQPRKHFDKKALKELSQSILKHGLLQPIVVIEQEEEFLLVAGERRLRAHKLADIKIIKAVVLNIELSEVSFRELALIENIQRENLNAIELAHSYKELIEVHNITYEELSSVVHKSKSHIASTVRLLSLNDFTQEKILHNKISQGHAKALIGLGSKKEKELTNKIIENSLTVREIEEIVKRYKEKSTKFKQTKPDFFTPYKEQIKEKLPFKHKIKEKTIEIQFKNEEEVKKFLELLKKV